jgi:hypothetical protein
MIDRHIEHNAQMRAAAGRGVARAPQTAALAVALAGERAMTLSIAALPGTLRHRFMPRW